MLFDVVVMTMTVVETPKILDRQEFADLKTVILDLGRQKCLRQ